MTRQRRLLLSASFMLAVVVATLGLGGLDAYWADALYRWQGGQWTLRDAFVTRTLIHDGGRLLVGAVAVAVMAASGWYWRRRPRLARYLARVLIGALVSMLAVNLLKGWTAVDCPWDLLRYGGSKPWLGLWDNKPPQWQPGRCFPAGHVSGAYAWLGFYFAACAWPLSPRMRHWALALPLCGGLIFGLAQQLRGAHFLSHDVVSLALCWFINLALWTRRDAEMPGRDGKWKI